MTGPADFDCSFASLDLVGAVLDVDVRRFPFVVPHHGRTEAQRRSFAEMAHDELAAGGLLRGTRFAPGFEHAVRLYARARTAVAMTGTTGHALAAADGDHGVLVVAVGDALRFHPTTPARLLPALTGLLPPIPRARGVSVTATDDRSADAARILRRPRLGSGWFTTMPGPATTVHWVDTDAGRYAVVTDTDRDDRLHATYTPADSEWLRRRLEEIAPWR